jgi:hypothetical protein
MSRFMLLQAFYAITGILFFVRDLYNKVTMGAQIFNFYQWLRTVPPGAAMPPAIYEI